MARLSVGAVVFIWGYINLHPWPSEWNSKWKIWMYQSHVSWFCRLVTVLCCSEYIIKLVWKYLKHFNFAEKFVYINYEKIIICVCVCDDAGATETKYIHAIWKWSALLSRQWAGQTWNAYFHSSSHHHLQVPLFLKISESYIINLFFNLDACIWGLNNHNMIISIALWF